MKKLSILFCSTILTLYCIGLQAQDVDIKPWKYNINIELKDSALWVNLSLKITKAQKGQNDFLLFNRYIQIKKAILDDRPFEYTRSNDTLSFDAI